MRYETELIKRIKTLEKEIARIKTMELPTLGLNNLSDPGSDKILFWDDSEGCLKWLEPNTNLAITGTDLDAS
jgi:hypothetical protein